MTITTALLFIIINKGQCSNNKIQIAEYARLTGNGAYSNTPLSNAPATAIIKIQKYIMEEKILV